MSEDDGYVYGREAVIRLITASKATAIVVTGDSGVGESTVLSGARRQSDGLTPPPVPVGAGPGSLPRALSTAVPPALAAHIDHEGQIPLLRERILAASKGLRRRAKERVREDLVNLLLDQVRMRIGDTAAEIMDETRSAWNESEQDSLQKRLAALTETDAAMALAGVASDLAAVADADVFLALDDVHLLTDDDLRRLRDLAAGRVARVHLRVAFTTFGAALDESLTRLAEAGSDRAVVDGLDEKSVRLWLTQEGIDASHTPAVMAATLGYALHVGDAIRLLRDNDAPGILTGLSQADVVLRGSERAWAALNDKDRRVALLLLPFAHRPGAQRTSSLLGIEPLRWSVLRLRLRESGVFVDRDDDSWFHELRRQALWRRLDDDTRTSVATQVVQWIPSLNRVSCEEVGVISALLSDANLDTATQDDSARVITRLSDDAVAVAAAVMDLAGLKVEEAFVNATGPLLRGPRQREVMLTRAGGQQGGCEGHAVRLESGKRKPTLEVLLRVAVAHPIPLDELMGAAAGDQRIRLKPEKRTGGRIVVSPVACTRGRWASPRTGKAAAAQARGLRIARPAGRGELSLLIADRDIPMKPGQAAEVDTQVPYSCGAAGDRPVETLITLGWLVEGIRVGTAPQPTESRATGL